LITARRDVRSLQRHLADCASCRRYDATVRRGMQALHAAAQEASIAPSPDFRNKLNTRLERERREGGATPARTRFAAALLVVIALALLVLDVGRRPQLARAPLLPPAAFPKPVANPGLPFDTFQDPRASVVNGNPYPYGTALVQPAVTQVPPAAGGR
jgi:hypothetical protein